MSASALIPTQSILSPGNLQYGGGLYVTMGDVYINNTAIVSNFAKSGGAVYAGNGRFTVDACDMSSNFANVNAGGMYCKFEYLAGLALSRSRLSNNTAGDSGGGLFCEFTGDNVALEDCSIDSNRAQNFGGGMAINDGLITLIHSQVTDNVADTDGGGLMISNSGLALDTSVISRNIGDDGGGVCVINGVMHIRNAYLSDNAARHSMGGAIYFASGTFGELRGTMFTQNLANVFGGGIALNGGSRLNVSEGCRFRDNLAQYVGGSLFVTTALVNISESLVEESYSPIEGGGMALDNDASVLVSGSVIRKNKAATGGGIHCNRKVLLMLDQVRQLAPRSEQMMRAARACEALNITVSGSTFFGNWALEAGGAIAADSSVQQIEIESSKFQLGQAMTGGAIFLDSDCCTNGVEFTELCFANHSAELGENIFWVYTDNITMVPDCVDCVCPADTALLRTTAVEYSVEQGGSAVPAEGVHARSGHAIFPALSYIARDFYGNLTWTPQQANNVAVSPNSSKMTLTGLTVNQYMRDKGAEFKDLTVTSDPSSVVQLKFSPFLSLWNDVALQVVLRPCMKGDVYSEATKQCTVCPAGSLKFSNDTTACSACSSEGLECPGGSNFTLLEGYWMSTRWVRAHCADGDAGCMLDRVYECPMAAACASPTSDTGRRSADGVPYIQEEELCAVGYRTDVVLCDACDSGYYRRSDECHRCPRAWVAWIRFLGILGVAAAIIWLVMRIYRIYSLGPTIVNRYMTVTLSSLLIGSLQIAGQTAAVLPRASFPYGYEDFLMTSTTCVNLPLVPWLALPCLMESVGLSGVKGVGGFYWEFTLFAVLPFVVCFPVAVAVLRQLWQDSSHSTRARRWSYVPAQFASGLTTRLAGLLQRSTIPRGRQPPHDSDHEDHDVALELAEADSVAVHLEEANGVAEELAKADGAAVELEEADSVAVELEEEADSVAVDLEEANGATVETRRAAPQEGPGFLPEGPTAAAGGHQKQRSRTKQPYVTAPEDTSADLQVLGPAVGAFLVFFHPTCATNVLQLYECERVYDVREQYFLKSDHDVECFTSVWYASAAISVVIAVTYFFGLPCFLAAAPHYLRKHLLVRRRDSGALVYVHEDQLIDDAASLSTIGMMDNPLVVNEAFSHDLPRNGSMSSMAMSDDHLPMMLVSSHYFVEEELRVYVHLQYDTEDEGGNLKSALNTTWAWTLLGPFMSPFKEQYYAWYAFDMLRKLSQTSLVTVIQLINPDYDLLYILHITALALAAHAHFSPYKNYLVNALQSILLMDQLGTVIVCLGQRYQPDKAGSLVVGVMVILIKVLLWSLLILLITTWFYTEFCSPNDMHPAIRKVLDIFHKVHQDLEKRKRLAALILKELSG
ncbi:hypothetical protein CYMTET_52118 [Cymbomonas tetramitiformis]|uniref:Right handed beta helix domain-containing protein n=1 Tax=Cymbomonas tetramitiformis TaxID=36881 RepID=A0AAE0ERZ1_9CHLO|nr:hypothetical protein CYMTET_52118 [Cymbomonas tetramitiformis]